MNTLYFQLVLAVSQLHAIDLTDPPPQALDRWKTAHVQDLKQRGPVAYQVRGITFHTQYAEPSGGPGPATSAVVTERTVWGDNTCTESMRELTLSWKNGDDQATVDKERLMGEDCCDLDHCSTRTAGGWMAHLVRTCAEREEQETRLARLINPKRAIRIEITSSDEPPGYRDDRWTRSDASALCNLAIATFNCDGTPPKADRFTCSTAYPDEHFEFRWRRTRGATYIESISGYIKN